MTQQFPNTIALMSGQVVNPAAQQQPDGNYIPFGQSRHGAMLETPLHSVGFESRFRGNGFVGSSGAAGVSIIAAAQTTAGFVLYNPAGSGVMVDLERIHISGATNMTQVLSGLGLEGSVQVPSSVTGATVTKFPAGAARGSNAAFCYSAATITAMTYICGLGFNVTSTSAAVGGQIDLQGRILLAPGFSVNLTSAITQAANKLIVDFFWSEWPV